MRAKYSTALVTVIAIGACLLVAGLAYAPPTKIRTGLTIHNTTRAWPSITVFAGNDGSIYGLDTEGNVVMNIPPPADKSFAYARPLDNGNLLVRTDDEITGLRSIQELDQVGHIVWNFDPPAGTVAHHDHSRLPNGNTLIMCAREFVDLNISPDLLEDDCLLEVDPAGTIVWDWQTADHYDDFNFSPEIEAAISDHAGDWAHGNAASAIPFDTSHTDPRFAPGNIVISYRFPNIIVIVDRTTGDIVWQTTMGTTLGQHDVEMLPDSLDGGGNIIVFDNGLGGHYNFGGPEVWRSFSRVVEIDPTDFSIAYEYKASHSKMPDFTFNSYFISAAQRLPNGNTFICEGAFGRMFEVTPTGRIVWEYISRAMGDFRGVPSNRVYRAEKVDLGWLQ